MAGLLAAPAATGLGVAAVAGRRTTGFLVPLRVELWGDPGAYVPEWGWAGPASLVAEMYAAAAPRWVGAGCRTHAATLWEHETEAEAVWHDLGFGRVVVDAVRGLEPPARRGRGVQVRRADRADAGTLAALERALWEHLAAAPVSRVHSRPGGRSEAAARLADPARPAWLADMEGSVAGFISFQPSDDAPAVLRSPDLVRCDGAFVIPERRGRGAATALLAAALRWAGEAGFAGCTLDFESANLEAARFWPAAGFGPVLHSVARRLA